MTRIKYRVYYQTFNGEVRVEEYTNLKEAKKNASEFIEDCNTTLDCADIYDVDKYGCNIDIIYQYCRYNGKKKIYTF